MDWIETMRETARTVFIAVVIAIAVLLVIAAGVHKSPTGEKPVCFDGAAVYSTHIEKGC